MDERQLEAQSRLLIELGEPETWLETMLRASRRSAGHEASQGNQALAKRWRKLTRGLEHAIAATVNDPVAEPASNIARQHVNPPIAGEPETQSQTSEPTQQHALRDDDAA